MGGHSIVVFLKPNTGKVFVKCQKLQQTGMKTKSNRSFGTSVGCQFLSWVSFWEKHSSLLLSWSTYRSLTCRNALTMIKHEYEPKATYSSFNNVPLRDDRFLYLHQTTGKDKDLKTSNFHLLNLFKVMKQDVNFGFAIITWNNPETLNHHGFLHLAIFRVDFIHGNGWCEHGGPRMWTKVFHPRLSSINSSDLTKGKRHLGHVNQIKTSMMLSLLMLFFG